MEEQVLPSPELRPVYGKAVWLHVYRDFERSEADRAAERIEIRFGLSAYPQHVVADPADFRVLSSTPRTPEGIAAAIVRAKAAPVDSIEERMKALRRAENLADEIQRSSSVELARKGIAEEDIVVRIVSARLLAEREPEALASRAGALLAVPNDLLRFAACKALVQKPDFGAARLLEALVEDPGSSRNPNMLRCWAVDALANCGDRVSLPLLERLAGETAPNNGLSRKLADALKKIRERCPEGVPSDANPEKGKTKRKG